MSRDLRQCLFAVFESCPVEELTALLQLLYLISLQPKTREAGPDFPHQAGSASQDANKTANQY
jgi:hypothetical protein